MIDDDDDEDQRLGIPDEFSQRAMLAEAVNKANQISRELRGQVSGMLAEYVRHVTMEASGAAALILTADPRDQAEIFRLQKITAGYASVMAWIRQSLIEGDQAQQDLTEIGEREEEHRDGGE